MYTPVVKGPKVYLAPHCVEDAEKYMNWFNDPEINQYAKTRFHNTLESEQDFLRKAHNPPTDFFFAVHKTSDNSLIGACGLHRVNPVHRNAVFGIFIGDKACWGKGFGTETTLLVLHYAFRRINVNRVELEVLTTNKRAIRAYEKAGFQHEGIARAALFDNGQFHDTVRMSILATEFDGLSFA